MTKYLQYVERLSALSRFQERRELSEWKARVDAALDGEAGVELRRAIPIGRLRESGAFFTPSQLARQLVGRRQLRGLTLDPACGAGNLLLAVARNLPIASSMPITLKLWGQSLAGLDVHEEFVRAAKLRLLLLALRRHGSSPRSMNEREIADLFPLIRVGDALAETNLYARATQVVLNPPFTLMQLREDCSWGRGKATAAAIFLSHCLRSVEAGTNIRAILPEVLRTGTRYHKWRAQVEIASASMMCRPYGLFDERTDVDVFTLRLVSIGDANRTARTSDWSKPRRRRGRTVGDAFEICVGPVVPFRETWKGPLRPYITASTANRWKNLRKLPICRRYSGIVCEPPFVVIRRTSRPGDRFRAVATVVACKGGVAVENHLLVCTPKNRTLKSCLALMRYCKKTRVSKWLDQTICCRHLTVDSMKQIPWPKG